MKSKVKKITSTSKIIIFQQIKKKISTVQLTNLIF